MALFNNLAQVRIAKSKTIRDIQYNKLGTRFASRIAKRLYFTQIWVETQTSAKSSFQKLNFDNSCHKHAKLDNDF